MFSLCTPYDYAVRFSVDVLEIGQVTSRGHGTTTIYTLPMRLWNILLLTAELHCSHDQATLILHQSVADISQKGKMMLCPTRAWAQFTGARPTDKAEEIGRQTLSFLQLAIGPEARRKCRAMRLTCQVLTELHPTAAQGKLIITTNGRLLFQPLSKNWKGIHPPRAFTKAHLPNMITWLGPTLQNGGPDPHGPRLQPARIQQTFRRPDGSRHGLLALIDEAQSALRETGLDPTGWFTEPRHPSPWEGH